jgi:ribonuclease HII
MHDQETGKKASRAAARQDETVLSCGIDEAGRGPIAGPVTAAAVILGEHFSVEGLADSKALGEVDRERQEKRIKAQALAWGIGWAGPREIDRLNILGATFLAMQRAFRSALRLHDEAIRFRLGSTPAERGLCVFVDGNRCPHLPVSAEPVIGGDRLIPEIQAASILAKTARDRFMIRHAKVEPLYGFDRHKGYPTAEHRRLVLELGPSRIARRSFRVRFASIPDDYSSRSP